MRPAQLCVLRVTVVGCSGLYRICECDLHLCGLGVTPQRCVLGVYNGMGAKTGRQAGGPGRLTAVVGMLAAVVDWLAVCEHSP